MSHIAHTGIYTFPADTKIVSFRTFKRKLMVVLSTGHVIQCRGDFDHQEIEFSGISNLSEECILISVSRLTYDELDHAVIEFTTDQGTCSVTFKEHVERDYLNAPSHCSLITTAIDLKVINLGENPNVEMEYFQHEDDVITSELLLALHKTNREHCLQ